MNRSFVHTSFIILAFALLVFLCSWFMSNIENRHIMNDARSALDTTELNISSNLQELENMHTYLSETARLMILQGASYEMVSKYITDINNYIFNDEKFKIYSTGVYGFFDVFEDKFHDGTGWIPPASYRPNDRPWYKTAVEANGKTTVTEPYISIATGVYTLTFTRRIFSSEGKPLGIVCLDIVLDGVRELITNTHFAFNGYGILLNSQFDILAHPDSTALGKKVTDINSMVAPYVEDLKRGKPVLEHKIKNYKGEKSILFSHQLKNGWYIAAMIPEETYFREMRKMRFSIIVLGTILATLFIVMAKKLAIAN
ncbi:MAG: cache domain-containing protein [Fibromonadaceae bacterium]|nr:cache domain-containing protein [Fibromonadaceae bacterium]